MTQPIRIRFLGGTEEVERSSILVSLGRNRILMDYGVKLSRPPIFPLKVAPREIDAILLSHAHLDHIGGLPMLYISGTMPIYMTHPSLDIADLLIRDFIKLSGQMLPYEYFDFQALASRARLVGYREKFKAGGTNFMAELLNAGHIPGSSQVLLEVGGFRILFTGDINDIDTNLLTKMDTSYGELDLVISESTYGGEDHPNRRSTEQKLIERTREVIENGGVVLIPAFAIGRSQEVLMVLASRKQKFPIYIDGMAVEATEIFLSHPSYLRNADALRRAYKRAEVVKRWSERKRIIREPCVIIAPAGMLGGGAVVFYLNKLYDNEKNAIFVVGFQVPGTPGRLLLEEGKAIVKGKMRKVKMRADRFHLSSHIDRSGFKRLFRSIKGDPKLFLVHGNKENISSLSTALKDELGLEVHIPKLGEEFEISSSGLIKRA